VYSKGRTPLNKIEDDIFSRRRLMDWLQQLTRDPLPLLTLSRNHAINYFAKRDLLDENAESVESLWQLPQALSLTHRQ